MQELQVVFNEHGDRIVFDEFWDEFELEVNRNFPQTPENWGIVIVTNSIILIVNIMVMVWAKFKDRNLIDKLVWLDCVANLSIIGVMFMAFPVRIYGSTYICIIMDFIRAVALFMNR